MNRFEGACEQIKGLLSKSENSIITQNYIKKSPILKKNPTKHKSHLHFLPLFAS